MAPRIPYIAPGTDPEMDPLYAQRFAEDTLASDPANYQEAPPGAFGLNGSGTDAAAAAVLRALQGAPRPRGFAANALAGFAQGAAGARVSQAAQRAKANEAETKRVAADSTARRTLAGQYARDLAKHRWEMQRDAAKAAQQKDGSQSATLGSAAYIDITDRPDIQKLIKARGAAIPSPDASGRIRIPASWAGPKPEMMNLSPEAIAAWGQFTAQTGGLPQGLGMGGGGLKGRLLEAGASFLKEGQDLATNKLTYKADAASFGKLQQLKDGASAFRRTAEGNFNMMLDSAKKLQDTGSPLVNRPLREWRGNVRGDADIAAYNAARLVIIPEFARLLTSATMAGQLTDEARKEVQSVVKGEYTLPQMIAVGKILFSDGERRETEYQRQLDEIVQRGRGARGVPQPAASDTSATMPAIVPQQGPGFAKSIVQSIKKARGR